MTDCTNTLVQGIEGQCLQRAYADHFEWKLVDGFSIFEIPYIYCQKNCRGYTIFPLWSISFVLFQFVFPALIFCTGIVKRYHLDLPAPLLRMSSNKALLLLQIPISLCGVGILKAIDILSWIAAIFAMAGPIVSSAVQEILLDYRVIKVLNDSTSITPKFHLDQTKRYELIVALLCGNFKNDKNEVKERVHGKLSLHPDPDTTKNQIRLILTSQPSYGIIVGIPTMFFLGSFLYNNMISSQSTAIGAYWAQLGFWWLIPVFVAIACGVVLTGSNPSTVSTIAAEGYIPEEESWSPLKDSYRSEVYPVWVWDRGRKKLEWIRSSKAWEDCIWFSDKVQFGICSWIFVITMSLALILAPCILAIETGIHFKQPPQSCSTLALYLYVGAQTWLVLVSVVRATTDMRYGVLVKPKVDQTNLQNLHKYLQWAVRTVEVAVRWFIILFTSLALIVAVLVSFLGNVAQIFGLYQNCFCSTSLTQWILPASERTVTLGYQAYRPVPLQQKVNLAEHLAIGTTVAVGVICYAGWVYQRVLRGALLDQIAKL